MAPLQVIDSKAAWYGPEIENSESWQYRLSADQQAEISRALAQLQAGGRPLLETTRADFPLPTVGPLLRELLEETEGGRGFFLLRNLPIETLSEAAVRTLYWGLGCHLGVALPQSEVAELIGDVRDIGHDSAVTGRGYRSNDGIEFHVDQADLVLLLCRRTAMSGGKSRLVSAVTVHNEIARRRPDLLAVLYEPLPVRKTAYDPATERPWFPVPVFGWGDGCFASRFSRSRITETARFEGAPRLTPIQHEAIDFVEAVASDPAIHLDMGFEPGDMQFVINRLIYHSRTDFEDHPDPDLKRHVLRMWLATPASRPLPESWKESYGAVEAATVRGGVQAWQFPERYAEYRRRAAESLGMRVSP
jgi:TfdA family taurine catabolism dioxygenase TauD